MKIGRVAAVAMALGLFTTFSENSSAQPYVYPGQGQSAEQQKQDEYDCYQWARQRTGFDPMQQPRASSPPPQQQAQQGSVLRGAARGATIGAVGGAIRGDAGKGAAIGAATGALFGGFRRRDQQRRQRQAEQQWAQQQAAQYDYARGEYERAYGACLGGRGYTVR